MQAIINMLLRKSSISAKTKSKLDNDLNVANKTKTLLEEPSVAKSIGNKTVPNLVTKIIILLTMMKIKLK